MVLIVFPLITMAFLKPAFRPALAASGYPDANGAEHVVPGQAAMSAFFVVSQRVELDHQAFAEVSRADAGRYCSCP